MKLAESGVTTMSTMGGNAQAMVIDPEGMAIILNMLSNMYGNAPEAVVREYSCNAFDSHKEAGNRAPIEIFSPTHLNPVFSVQDYGVGLSRDEMLNVYARYGASTKRQTNDQIGSFGIGAKSAFTVGTQFTVTAVKNGLQTIALFAINDTGAPTVNIISHSAVKLPNGVRVDIGVTDVDGINREISKMFATWERGTVLVDGKQPECIWDNAEKIADDIHILMDSVTEDHWFAVMGGVCYKLPASIISKLPRNHRETVNNLRWSSVHVYMTIPVGAADVTPSREGLRDTDKTVRTITEMVDNFSRAITKWAERRIEGAESLIAAAIQLSDINRQLNHRAIISNPQWRGQEIPTAFTRLEDAEYFHLRYKRGGYSGGGGSDGYVAGRDKGFLLKPDHNIHNILFVTNVPEKRVRSVQNAAKAYFLSHTEGREKFEKFVVALVKPIQEYNKGWCDLNDPVFQKTSYDDFVAAWKTKTERNSSPKNPVAYDVLAGNDRDYFVTPEQLNKHPFVYYLPYNDHKSGSLLKNQLFAEMVKNTPVILLSATQKAEALAKRVPAAVNARGKLGEFANHLLDNLTETDKSNLADYQMLQRGPTGMQQFLRDHKNQITNPVILNAVAEYQSALANIQGCQERLHLIEYAVKFTARKLPEIPVTGKFWLNAEGKLPLLAGYLSFRYRYDRYSNEAEKHAILYVNAVSL